MERQIDPAEYRLLRFGVLRSGSIRNVVSDHARLEGTMRACRDEIYDHMRDQLDAIARRYAPAQFAFSFSEGYQRSSTRRRSSIRRFRRSGHDTALKSRS